MPNAKSDAFTPKPINEITTWIDLKWDPRDMGGDIAPELQGYKVRYKKTGDEFAVVDTDEKYVQIDLPGTEAEKYQSTYKARDNKSEIPVGDGFVYGNFWELVDPEGNVVQVDRRSGNESVKEDVWADYEREVQRCPGCGEELVKYGGAGMVCTNPACNDARPEVIDQYDDDLGDDFGEEDAETARREAYADAEVEEKKIDEYEVIDATPTWISLLPLFKEFIYSGNRKQKEYVIEELENLMRLADKHNEDAKAAKAEAQDAKESVEEGSFMKGIRVTHYGMGGELASEFAKTEEEAKAILKKWADLAEPGDTFKLEDAESESTTESVREGVEEEEILQSGADYGKNVKLSKVTLEDGSVVYDVTLGNDVWSTADYGKAKGKYDAVMNFLQDFQFDADVRADGRDLK